MVFSSHQVNDQFDSNYWQQENQHHLENATINQNPNFNIPQFSSQPTSEAGSSQARVVNSMVERARIAKVPLPEASLKCPRCDSTNTKFCYFNNYNLTQPRHFCKACRRYWTRGGALRNVPVGGGFRRNKRSKSNGNGRSKSTDNNNTTSSSLACEPSYLNPSKFLGYGQTHGFASNLPTLPPIQSLGGYNSSNIGLDFGAMMSSNGGILDQWRVSSMQQAPQFPFLINTPSLIQSSNVLYPLPQGNSQGNPQESSDYSNQHLRSKPLMDMANTQTRNVKEEEDVQDDQDSLSRNFMGNISMNSAAENSEYTPWGGNSNINSTSWTGFASNNSTSHLTF